MVDGRSKRRSRADQTPNTETTLTSRTRELRALFKNFTFNHYDRPLAWVTMPAELHWQSRLVPAEPHSIPLRPSRLHQLRLAVGSYRSQRRAQTQRAKLFRAGDVLFEADSANHWRALEPVMRRFGEPSEVCGIPTARLRSVHLIQQALALTEGLQREARARGIDLGLLSWDSSSNDIDEMLRRFMEGAAFLAYAEAVIDKLQPRAVITPSTLNVPTRALIHAARAAMTPSVYIPHAPIGADPLHHDLPVDFVGLRGVMEAQIFEDWGAPGDRLTVVGNTSIPERSMIELNHSSCAALAPPPPDRFHSLGPLFAMVEQVLGAEVIVSPHPRSDREVVRALMPDGWTLWDGTTFELLEAGPPMLLQSGSGVAVEALYLGIPTIDVSQPKADNAVYPVISEPHVRKASGADELSRAVALAREQGRSRLQRAKLREWASLWSRRDAHTLTNASALVERAMSTTVEGPIWDLWGEGANIEHYRSHRG